MKDQKRTQNNEGEIDNTESYNADDETWRHILSGWNKYTLITSASPRRRDRGRKVRDLSQEDFDHVFVGSSYLKRCLHPKDLPVNKTIGLWRAKWLHIECLSLDFCPLSHYWHRFCSNLSYCSAKLQKKYLLRHQLRAAGTGQWHCCHVMCTYAMVVTQRDRIVIFHSHYITWLCSHISVSWNRQTH
jgi:hypothetical protein